MKHFLGLLFLLVNIYAASTRQSNIFIACLLLCICISFIYVSKKQGNSLLIALVELLCYTWSSSWRNIFGGSFADIPIPWFYLIGLVIVLYFVFNRKFRIQKKLFIMLWILITLGLIPVIISADFREAITEYITLLFFYLVIGAVSFSNISIKEDDYFSVLKSFVYAILFSSIFIIFQFVVQYLYGYNFIRGTQSTLLGGRRLVSSLMFDDVSSATICLGIGVIIILLNLKKFKYPYFMSLFIITGMTLTSARTGFIALIMTCVLYLLFAKNIINKFKVLVIIAFAGLIGLTAFFVVRDISSIDVLLNDNGRFDGYITAFNIWFKHPILGIGFGDSYLSQLMQMPIPHFSLLKILTQTGIIYTLCLLALLLYYYKISNQSIYNCGKYMLIHVMIGALFVPGIFSARFLTVIIIIISLQEKVIQSKSSSCENIQIDTNKLRRI